MFAAKLRAHAGTTSACAENTIQTELTLGIDGELPPRARRILIQAIEQPFDCGTTSACAENTRKALVKSVCVWNYLRVRGEYMRSPQRGSQPSELPPRARRIHRHHPHSIRNHGTTSACAENTFTYIDDGIKPRNYLRVRGEYTP